MLAEDAGPPRGAGVVDRVMRMACRLALAALRAAPPSVASECVASACRLLPPLLEGAPSAAAARSAFYFSRIALFVNYVRNLLVWAGTAVHTAIRSQRPVCFWPYNATPAHKPLSPLFHTAGCSTGLKND